MTDGRPRPTPAAPRVAAVVPMAGRGTRVGAPTAKQFWPLLGRPLYLHTLFALAEYRAIREIAVAAPPELAEAVRREIEAAGFPTAEAPAPPGAPDGDAVALPPVRVAAGGESRHLSIAAALSALSPCDVVLVHDAVRPFVDPEILDRLVQAVGEAGVDAAGAVRPLVDTVVRGEDGWLLETVPRERYRASQTPQAFRYEALLEAYRAATREELLHGTECLELVRSRGGRVRLVEAGPELWKVTYKHDLYAAKEMMRERQRRTALVTGGSRGIGFAVARALRDRGLEVAVAARERDSLARAAREIGALALPGDVSRPEEARSLVRRAVDAFGRLDVLVNNAGVASLRPLAETDDELWQEVVATNLSGAFYCAREAMRQMGRQGGGVIIQIGSSAVRGGRPGQGAYAATKAGLLALTEAIALEGKELGIHAFTVVPERTATELRRRLYPEEDPSQILQPETVAEVVAFCATEWLGPLSGQSFWVRR
ncbi:MAG: bifunctional cytidylyltransferase/SDR family oxidoreductase [Clostridia bacterium]|nr:bifunctional cytidylyltransferase/SDR family oxidoreductase [Clostridia bacterium]